LRALTSAVVSPASKPTLNSKCGETLLQFFIYMHEENNELIYPEQLMVMSSIQILIADKNDPKPVGFGSGCIIKHRERFFLLSERHVTEVRELTTFLETNLPPDERGTPIQPIGGLCYFDTFKVEDTTDIREFEDLLQNGKPLDITFAEIKQHVDLLQPEMDFGAFKVNAGHKIILDTAYIAQPDKQKTYGFFGRTKQDYDGIYLKSENTLKHNLKYSSTLKHFHVFVAPELITDEKDYQGCSGAPILDSEGKLLGLACLIKRNTKVIYGFSIQECIKLLNIAIDTGMLLLLIGAFLI